MKRFFLTLCCFLPLVFAAAADNETVVFTFPFDKGGDGQVATFSGSEQAAEYFTSYVTKGDGLAWSVKGKPSGGTIYQTRLQSTVLYEEALDENRLDFKISALKGLEFVPNKVSFQASKWGTNNCLLDVFWLNSDGTIISLAQGIDPLRNTDSEVTKVILEMADAPSSEGDFGLRINVYNLGTTKYVGIADVVIEGQLYGEPDKYCVNVTVPSETASNYSIYPAKENYYNGDEITLRVTPYAGFSFKEWVNEEGKIVSRDNPYTFLITNDVNLTATFEKSGDSQSEIGATSLLSESFELANNIKQFYDIDGDKTLEWTTKSCNLYKYEMRPDNPAVSTLASRVISGHYEDGPFWTNFDNDSIIDIYDFGNEYYYRGGAGYAYTLQLEPSNDASSWAGNNLYYVQFDYNNDGHPDFVNRTGARNEAFTLFSDGDTCHSQVMLRTPEEWAGAVQYKSNRGPVSQSASVALSSMSIVSASASPIVDYSEIPDCNMDVNGDGIQDYLNCLKGIYIQNLGDGTGIYNELGGRVLAVDINGDGMMDFVGWDEESQSVCAYFFQKDGTIETKKIFSGAVGQAIWCRDFDKDEDIDLLLSFNINGNSYLLMAENQGAGKFKNHEYYYPNELYFQYCVDFDSDGHYELLASEIVKDSSGNAEENSPICYFEVEGTKISETPTYIEGVSTSVYKALKYTKQYFMVADIDNSGVMTLISQSADKQFTATPLSSTANRRPAKPAAPTFVYEQSSYSLKINWTPTTDAESSSADLTYALRIGTEPGACDILYVHAHKDGTRKNMMGGNQGHNLYRMLNTQTWAEGKYYISVQAVDPNNRGSEFSDEVVFEKKQPVNVFSLDYTQPFGVGDTCFVKLHPNVNTSNTLNWNWDGAKVIGNSTDGRSYQLLFDEAGDKTITLSVGSSSQVFAQSITVQPFATSVSPQRAIVGIDLDEDGKTEFLWDESSGYSVNYSFYTYTDENSFSRINKLFNENSYIQKISVPFTFDLNNDGMCDVFTRYNQFGGYGFFSIMNEGDKNMSVNTDMVSLTTTEPVFYDLNNDGWLDYFYEPAHSIATRYHVFGVMKNNGYYTSFEQGPTLIGEGQDLHLEDYGDYTNDGLVDALVRENYKENSNWYYRWIVYENQGDFTFLAKDTLLSSIPSHNLLKIEDFDNDGKYDLLYSESNKYYNIYWNDGTTTFLEGVTNVAEDHLFDFNNDGLMDIQVQQGNKAGEWGVLLFDKSRNFQIMDLKVDGIHSSSYVNTSDPIILPDGKLHLKGYEFSIPNTLPTSPTNLSIGRNSRGVTISWKHGDDAETPVSRLRYNISVKRKGQEGEGSYLISPCNSTKNGVNIPSNKLLVRGNNFFIPTASIPVGEYEVQVQTVDLQMGVSDFSEVFTFKVDETINIEAPASTGINRETLISIASNMVASVDWDGGTILGQNGNQYTVVWNTSGSKTIKAGGSTQTIYVYPLPDATFTLPATVIQGATVNVPAKSAKAGQWSISADGMEFVSFGESGLGKTTVADDEHVILVFNAAGTYTVRYTVPSEYGDGVSESRLVVTDKYISPELTGVTAANGYYQLSWTNPEELPDGVTGINIYKETSRLNEYKLLQHVETAASATFNVIDQTSMPDVQSARYALSYVTAYGESVMGTPHQGMHVMINKGIGTSWNLTWTKYEGRKVDTYRILRGTTSDNMELIGEVSGNMSSYSDLNPAVGILYYAVEIVHIEAPQTAVTRTATATSALRSNIISTDMANSTVFVEGITLYGGEIVAGENNYLDILAHIYPYYATYQGLNWVVTEGNELATIDNYGRLTATGTGDGDVVVRAYALDGSGVYAESTIRLDGFAAAGMEELCEEQGEVSVRILQQGRLLEVQAPVGTPVFVYDLMGRQVLNELQKDTLVQYPFNKSGIHILRAGDKSYKFVVR